MYSDVHDDTNNNTDGDADGQYDDDDISGVDGDGNMTNNKEYAYLWVTYLKGGQQDQQQRIRVFMSDLPERRAAGPTTKNTRIYEWLTWKEGSNY